MRIVFTTQLPAEGFRRLETYFKHSTNGEGLVMCMIGEENWQEGEVLVSTFDYKVPRALIDSMPRLQLIANFGAGYNNIELSACQARGIRVTNTPQPVIEPTAELAFALMIDVARRVSEFDREMRNGLEDERMRGLEDERMRGLEGERCEPVEFGVMRHLSHSLYGKTLGIIGMGRIGQALARRALASGMRIIYHNRHRLSDEIEEKYHAGYVDFQTLLQDSDFVSLNLPYTPEVHHLIGQPEFGMMKRSAYLINTARGAHVDEEALVEALQSGIIAGAAMDVYEHEPAISSALLRLPNVVLSPHTGTGTWEGRIAMCENVTDNILAYVQNNIQGMNIVL